jgi:hypothetical protein
MLKKAMRTRRERLLKAIEGIRHTSKVRQSGRAASFVLYAALAFLDRFFCPANENLPQKVPSFQIIPYFCT